GFDTPSGIAAGGGIDSRRPAPVSTPRKTRSEAPRTPAAAFTPAPSSGGLGRPRLDRSNEPVAQPPHGVDPAGAELAAQRGDVDLDHVGAGVEVEVPHHVEQLR